MSCSRPDLFWRLEPGVELGYERGGLQEGLRLLSDVRCGQVRSRTSVATVAALRRLPECNGKVGRARLLPRRQARLSRRGPARGRLRRRLLRRRHREEPARRRRRSNARSCCISPGRTDVRSAGGGRTPIKGALRGPARGRDLCLSGRRPRLRLQGAAALTTSRPRGWRIRGLDRASCASVLGPHLRSARVVGQAHPSRVRHPRRRRDHDDHGGAALRQPHPDHDRRRRPRRAAPLLSQPLHPEDAEGHAAGADLAHHRRRPRGRRDAVLLHP